MTFQFPQVGALADQIAQLQEELDKLTTAIAPLKECEQQATELLEEVTKHAQLMRDKGIEEQSLIDWANQMYCSITGKNVEQINPACETLTEAQAIGNEFIKFVITESNEIFIK